MISMKLSKYLEIIHPVYITLKITPDTSIRNYNSSTIAKAINYTYRSISQRIHKEGKILKLKFNYTFEQPAKVSFFIDICKNDVSFYFIIPEHHYTLIKQKITDTWGKATIEVVEDIKPFSSNATKYQLNYSKEDAMSINTDKDRKSVV